MVTYASGASGWLSIGSDSGSLLAGRSVADSTSLVISGNMQPGTYDATVTIQNDAVIGDPISVPVTLTIEAARPAMKVSPLTMSFSAVQDGPAAASQSFSVTNAGARDSSLDYSVQSSDSRVTAAGSATPLAAGQAATWIVSVDTTGLVPGTYHATIRVTSNETGTTQTINVTYTVHAPNPFAGSYVGSYTGTGSAYGYTDPLNGSVAFTVADDGTITVSVPGGGQGTVTPSGSGEFAGAGGFGSVDNADYTFDGTFVVSKTGVVTARGHWTATAEGASGSGTWTATRG